MKVLNLLTSGSFGGIEVYCKNIGITAGYENGFCFLFGEGGIYDEMKEENLTTYSLSAGRKISLIKLSKLVSIAKTYDIIVVHHGDPFLESYFLALKLLLPNKKYARTIHSCFENYNTENYGLIKKSLCNFLERRLMSICDLIIAVSNAVKDSYKSYFEIDEKKLIIVYNGIGREKLSVNFAMAPSDANNIRILYVGRLVKEKGVHMLLEAFSILSKQKNMNLTIVGDGVERVELEKYAKELGVEGQVCFAGFQSQVGDYLSNCDIFVSPTQYESFGISIVEAMAYGCICVSNPVGGVPEIIKDNVNGFLTEAPDVQHLIEAIARAIEVICSSSDGVIRKNARNCAEYFSIDNTCMQLEQNYKKLMI